MGRSAASLSRADPTDVAEEVDCRSDHVGRAVEVAVDDIARRAVDFVGALRGVDRYELRRKQLVMPNVLADWGWSWNEWAPKAAITSGKAARYPKRAAEPMV